MISTGVLVSLVALATSVYGGQSSPWRTMNCPYGSVGACRRNGACPSGSTCTAGWFGARGRCCRSRPVREECRFGQRGICGGIAGLVCPSGTTCRFMQPFPDGAGKCCTNRPDTDTCSHGQSGFCGGIAGLACQDGYTCKFIPTDIADGMGKCCKNKPKGECPKPSGLATICVFDPERNCLGDEFCPPGHLCCSEGCGSVCKPAVYPLPEPTLPVPVPLGY